MTSEIGVQHTFIQAWSEMLWRAMSTTGKGYRRHSLKHTGVDKDRRPDKLDKDGESSKVPNWARAYYNRRGV
jgi:hypothetical protein